MKTYACVDIGGTNTRVQLWSTSKKVIAKTSFRTKSDDPVVQFNKIATLIRGYQVDYEVLGIGMSIPGPTNYQKGVFVKLPNMPKWSHFNFMKYIENETKINNIKADNDANLMALTHHFEFRESKNDITQFFTVSTGLGAGLIINDEIYTGYNHFAQEIAFAPVSWIPEVSSRFGRGALEHFASGSGILARARPKYQTTKEVFDNYQNDPLAKRIIDEAIATLGNMIATTLALINPSIIVFDGSVARHNKWYIEAALADAKTNTLEDHFRNLRVHFGNKGDDAAIEGAFHLISKS